MASQARPGRQPTLLLVLCLLQLAAAASALAEERLKIGVLKFGTVSWMLDTMTHHGLDVAQGVRVEVLELAGKDATSVALQAGEVDLTVTDWMWAMRQRAEGADYVFAPYSTALGALMAAPGGPGSLGDLEGKRLGVAGGPLDKSWLLLRALGQRRLGRDLQETAQPVFAAPPLLNHQIVQGRLDAVLTFWPFAARLEAAGFQRVMDVSEILAELGIEPAPPLVGFVFHEPRTPAQKDSLTAFLAAFRAASRLLAESDEEWERLKPLMRAASEAEFRALRRSYRRGIPERWGAAERDAAARLYQELARLGGPTLVGSAKEFDPNVFWSGARH